LIQILLFALGWRVFRLVWLRERERVPLAAETDGGWAGDDLIEFARMRMGNKEKREAKKREAKRQL